MVEIFNMAHILEQKLRFFDTTIADQNKKNVANHESSKFRPNPRW
jgi:hypothetical protein